MTEGFFCDKSVLWSARGLSFVLRSPLVPQAVILEDDVVNMQQLPGYTSIWASLLSSTCRPSENSDKLSPHVLAGRLSLVVPRNLRKSCPDIKDL